MNSQEQYQVRIESGDGSEYAKGGLTFEQAQAIENAANFALEQAGGVFDEVWQVWRFDGGREVEVLVFEDNDEDFFPGGEIGRVLAQDSADEYRKIAQQNLEDARPQYENSYMGIRGTWNPDDGWIYEP